MFLENLLSNFIEKISSKRKSSYFYIWLFRSKKTGQISQLDLNKTKYESKCVQLNIFDFKCFLFIDYFSEEDVGQYYFKSNLKENPKISFVINT